MCGSGSVNKSHQNLYSAATPQWWVDLDVSRCEITSGCELPSPLKYLHITSGARQWEDGTSLLFSFGSARCFCLEDAPTRKTQSQHRQWCFFFWSGWSDLSSPFFCPLSIPVVPLSHQLLFIDSKLGEEETEGRAGRAVTLRGVTLLLFFLYFLDSSFSHFLSILQSSSVSEQFSFKCEESRFLNTVGSVCLFLPLASRFFSCLQQLRSSSSTYGIRKKKQPSIDFCDAHKETEMVMKLSEASVIISTLDLSC